MQDALSLGFGRKQVGGWTSQESAWLIESTAATVAERMCALPPHEAEQWIRLADVDVSPEVAQRLLGHEVLVLVPRARYPAFCDSAESMPLVDLQSLAEEETFLDEAVGWIELEVRTAAGAPAANVEYELALPSGEVLRGRTDPNGWVRHETLRDEHGDCELRFPAIDAA